jgi:hypothetical protein
MQARDSAELDTMNSIITGEPSTDKLQASILEFLKTKTGASAGYLGMCEQMKETPPVAEGEEAVEVVKDVIKYVSATSNNKFMLGKQLVKEQDGPEGPNLTQQGILTFSMFEKVEDKPAPTEEVPDPPAPEGGWSLKWKEPYVKVDEVLRQPKIKYFRTPKLGSYLAVPFEYSYEVDSMNEGDGPELVAGECPPFPEYSTTSHSTRGCLALDTLGTDGEFQESDCSTSVEWTNKLAEGLARVANEKVGAERAARQEFKDKNIQQWGELEAQPAALLLSTS